MATSIESITAGPPAYRVPKGPQILGEGPIYRAGDSTLHWVDALSEPSELCILSVDPDTGIPLGEARVLPLEDSITIAVFRKNKPGSYLAAYHQGLCFLDEATGKFEVAQEIIPSEEREDRRLNDGAVDAAGRFWVTEIDLRILKARQLTGKVPDDLGVPNGRLWRYDADRSLHLMIPEGISAGNGIAFSPDNKILYINDTPVRRIWAFDFDLESGDISNRRLLVDFAGLDGYPDGMVVDVEGSLWVAMYQSSRVLVFSPEGRHLKEIIFPARNPTGPAWGGKDHNLLFVSSAKDQTPNADPSDEGGHLFLYKLPALQGLVKPDFAG